MFTMYCDAKECYSPTHFNFFPWNLLSMPTIFLLDLVERTNFPSWLWNILFILELVENANDSFCLTWWKEPTSQVDYATFYFFWNFLSMSMILFAWLGGKNKLPKLIVQHFIWEVSCAWFMWLTQPLGLWV